MAPAISYALPAMQLMCHLVVPETPAFNITNTSNGIAQDLHAEPAVTEPPLQTQYVTALPAGYVAYPHIGVAYNISRELLTWKAAREKCIEKGAHLAVIDSFIKFEYLMNQTSSDYLLVGIHRMYDDTEWVSATTGSTITNLPWAPGYPSGEKDCVYTSRNPRGLCNYLCNHTFYYVCELPIPENYN